MPHSTLEYFSREGGHMALLFLTIIKKKGIFFVNSYSRGKERTGRKMTHSPASMPPRYGHDWSSLAAREYFRISASRSLEENGPAPIPAHG
jgi:hypothetical protein